MSKKEFKEYVDTFCEHYQKEKKEVLTFAIIKEIQKEVEEK